VVLLGRSPRRAARRRSHAIAGALAAIALILLVSSAAGCGIASNDSVAPDPAAPPQAVRLDTPQDAVRSYLEWISYAYRIGDSDVASPTLTPDEAVRVDAYVQYNAQQGRSISQQLDSLELRVAEQTEATATVTAQERWTYRYLSLDTAQYSGPTNTASYDTTYTVIKGEDGLWRVSSVEAAARGKVE